MSLKGVYENKENPNDKIIIERDYKKRDYVEYFCFMCDKTGGGAMEKEELLKHWFKVK